MKKKMLCVLFAIAAATFVFTGVAAADGPWSIFGDAVSVKEGQPPNPWAIQLSAACPGGFPECLIAGQFTFGGVSFQQPNRKLIFADIEYLGTDYMIKTGDCTGGSPRFMIGIDGNRDGVVEGHVLVYFGTPPDYTGCEVGEWVSTGNLVKSAELIFDTTQVGGTSPDSYENALALVGDAKVPYIILLVDGGLMGEQVALVDNVKVNNFKLTAKGYSKPKPKPKPPHGRHFR